MAAIIGLLSSSHFSGEDADGQIYYLQEVHLVDQRRPK